jgi:hypothetical protein
MENTGVVHIAESRLMPSQEISSGADMLPVAVLSVVMQSHFVVSRQSDMDVWMNQTCLIHPAIGPTVCFHDTTCCPTDGPTGWTTGCIVYTRFIIIRSIEYAFSVLRSAEKSLETKCQGIYVCMYVYSGSPAEYQQRR